MDIEEQKLIEKCQQGDLEKFGGLYDIYADKIYRFIYFKTHHTQTTQDLTSQTFFKAMEAIKSFDPARGLFSSWLYRIARNTVIDHYRTYRKELDIADVWDLRADDDLERDSQLKEQIEKAKQYLNKLSREQKEIVLMRIWDGLSYYEISQILNKSQASCKMIFFRAMAKLRQEEILALILFLLLINKII